MYTLQPIRRLALLGVLIVLLIVSTISIPLYAQPSEPTALNLTTSPLPINLVAKPGESVSTELRIKNGGTRTENLRVSLMKFAASNESGQPQLLEREESDDYFDWVTFSSDTLSVEPNVWATINMEINLPDSAAFGYYYAVVFSRAQPATTAEQSTAVHGGTAVLVLLEARVPHAKREISIESFLNSKRVYEFLPATFEIRLRNNGNVHVAPAGSIFINRGSKELAVVSINPSRGNILPGSVRNFSVEWNDGFPAYEPKIEDGNIISNEQGEPVKQLVWKTENFSKIRFGKYSATALVVYDDGNRDIPVETTITFWVIPWRIIGVGLIITAIVGIGIYAIAKRLIRLINTIKKRGYKRA